MNDETIEQEIQAKGLTAPRVTPADVEENIASEYYFTGADGYLGAGLSSPGRLNATSTNELSATGESAAPGVVFDCAYTTLQLNHLQADIEAQPGYKE